MAIKTTKIDVEEVKKTENKEVKSLKKVKAVRKSPDRYPSHHKGHGKVASTVCIKNVATGVVDKVSRSTGDIAVCSGSHTYAKRSEWRLFRDAPLKKAKK
jgi:hypothetical protein